MDVRIKQCHIFELIHDSLVIPDTFQCVLGHQSIQLLFGALNFHVNDAFVVVLAARFHFTIVVNRLQKDQVEQVDNDVDQEGVNVDLPNPDLHNAIHHEEQRND